MFPLNKSLNSSYYQLLRTSQQYHQCRQSTQWYRCHSKFTQRSSKVYNSKNDKAALLRVNCNFFIGKLIKMIAQK